MAKILIVDDEPHMRMLVSAMLTSADKKTTHEIVTAENGVEAIEIVKSSNLDLVITDLVMPEKNGIDLIMEMKNLNKNLKVLAMSGGGGINGRFDYLPVAQLLGAENVLRKPFKREELCDAVSKILN